MNIFKALIISSVAVIVIACGGAEERKAAYMEKAEQSLNAGDVEKARIELKNVLQIDPKDAQAYFKLGNIFEQKKEYRKAFGNYSKAAELDPENSEYQAKLGRFHLLLAGDVDKATEYMDRVLAKDNNDVNGLLLKAGILLKQGNVADAKEIARSIYNNHPDNVENSIFLASLYSRDKLYSEAIAVLEEAVKKKPDNQQLLSLLGNALFINKDYSRSEQVWKRILNEHPDVFRNHVALAIFYQKIGESAKAEEVLRTAITTDEEDIQRKLVLVEFIQQTKGGKQAITELKDIIINNPNEGSLRLALAQLQIAEDDIDAAQSTYETAVKDFPEDETGITSRLQLAKIYMQKQDVDAATSIIDDAAEIAPNDSEVNLLKAKIALNNKNIDQAIISLRTVIKDSPENVEAYFLLAGAHRANNEGSQAEEIITRAYENNRDNIKALMPLAKYHVQNKNVVEAEKVIDDYLRLDADNYEALSIKASILNGKKDYEAAYDLAEKMVSLYPDKENGYSQSVPYLLSNNEADTAIDLLKTGYEKTGNTAILRLLAEVQLAAGKAAEAVASLNTVSEEDKSEQTLLLLAKAYAAEKDTEAAKNVLRDSIMQDKSRSQSYISLASVYVSENNMQQAISTLQDGVNANPDDGRLSITLATFIERNGDIDSAISQYEKILESKPDNLLANNNLAALLSDHKTDEISLKRAKELADKLKDVNQPVIQDTVGWVYYRTGNDTEAVEVLEKVVAAQPDVAVFNYHLGMAYYRTGNKAEARKYLEAALASDQDFKGRDEAEQTLNSL
jgi:Tfp pilus assembly protein PilF